MIDDLSEAVGRRWRDLDPLLPVPRDLPDGCMAPFVVAGANDPRVPASESAQMVEVVRKNGTPVWWLLGKDEGHGFAKKKNRDYEFYATVTFVKEYLLK